MTTQTMPPPSPPSAPPHRNSGATLLRVLGLGFALVAVAAGTLNIVGSIARDSATQHATYDGVRSVEVHVPDQGVEVTGGAGSSVMVDRTVTWSLRKPKVTEQQNGDHLVIRVDCGFFDFGRGCGGHIRLTVPSTTDLTLSTSDGSLSVTGVSGSVTASTADGAIRMQDVTGPLNVHTSDGSIEASGLGTAPVQAQTADGSIQLRYLNAPRSVQAQTADGRVELLLPRGPESYRVDAETADGSRTVEVKIDPASAREITVQTADGSIHIAYLN